LALLSDKNSKATSALSNLNSNNSTEILKSQNLFYDENWKLADKTGLESVYIENGVAEFLKALPLFYYEIIQHETYLFSKN